MSSAVIRNPFVVAVRKPQDGLPGTRGSVPGNQDTFLLFTLSTPTQAPSIVRRQFFHRGLWLSYMQPINPFKTKSRLLYLETQFVPRSKHFSSWLQKPVSWRYIGQKSLLVLRYIQNTQIQCGKM